MELDKDQNDEKDDAKGIKIHRGRQHKRDRAPLASHN